MEVEPPEVKPPALYVTISLTSNDRKLVRGGRRIRFWRQELQWICRVCVSIRTRRLAPEGGDVALGEMTAVIRISIAATHVVTWCLVEQQKYSTRWHTHTHTYSHPHKARKKNHEHSRVSNSYKEENGVRAFEDELSCSLSIKLHFLCLFISSFFFSDSNTSQQKILCLPPRFFLFVLGLLASFFFPFSSACEGESFLVSSLTFFPRLHITNSR